MKLRTIVFCSLVLTTVALAAACTRATPSARIERPAAATPAASASSASTAAAAPRPADVESLDAILEPIRAKFDLPGLGGAIVTHAGLRAVGVAGVRKRGDRTPALWTDPFHIGSDGKAMTATAIARLVEQGKLGWSTTIGDVFPELASSMQPAYKAVTLEQILAMRGGFPHETVPMGCSHAEMRAFPGTPAQQRMRYVREALQTPPEAPPGTKYIYANMGYVVAAVMGERADGAAWDEQMQRLVYDPLKMDGVVLGAPSSAGAVDAPWPHDEAGEPVPPGPLADNPVAVSPAGRMAMPLASWSRFVADRLAGLEGLPALLRPETYARLHEPPFGGNYFAGWITLERSWAGGRVFTHAGSNTMNFAVVWLAPKKDIAVLVVTNSGAKNAAEGCDAVAGALIQHALPKPEHAQEAR